MWQRFADEPVGGFTLVETLVALAVLAGGLMALQNGLRGGLAATGLADVHSAALGVALARRDAAGIEQPLEPGVTSGRVGAVDWQTEIKRYEPAQQRGQPGRLEGFWVNTTVRWRPLALLPERTLTLTTIKLKAVP